MIPCFWRWPWLCPPWLFNRLTTLQVFASVRKCRKLEAISDKSKIDNRIKYYQELYDLNFGVWIFHWFTVRLVSLSLHGSLRGTVWILDFELPLQSLRFSAWDFWRKAMPMAWKRVWWMTVRYWKLWWSGWVTTPEWRNGTMRIRELLSPTIAPPTGHSLLVAWTVLAWYPIQPHQLCCAEKSDALEVQKTYRGVWWFIVTLF